MDQVDSDTRTWVNALELRSRRALMTDEIAAIAGLRIRKVSLTPGAHFFREGDPSSRCGFVVEGALYQTKLTRGGGRQIVGLRLQNDFVGLQNLLLETTEHDLQALTNCRVLEVQSGQLLAIIHQFPGLAKILMADVMISCSIALDWIVNAGRRDAHSRVAHLLCELALRIQGTTLESGARYVLPLTQQQLGDAVGLGRVAVNRAMRDLTQLNIAICDKSCITILDPIRLAEIGDFTARYLHLGQSGRDRRKSPRGGPSLAWSSAA